MNYKMNDYLLSVVIPTKNRQEYVMYAIHQIMNVTGSETQIVIQDNSDDNGLLSQIENLNSTRIKYHYTSELLSFVDNFEIAVSLADGEYITVIGDDDGVLSSIVPLCEWAKNNDLDAITSKINVTYYWPNSGAKNYKCTEELGYVRISDYSKKITKINNTENLKRVLNNGCQFYHSSGIPKIYHGLVRKKVIDEIKNKYGRLFMGLSPDIYSSFAITLNTYNSYFVDYPFTIDGNCRKSGAGAQAQGKHTGKLSDAPHFKGNPNYKWEELVPRVYSIQTIWADSGVRAIRNIGTANLISEFSVEMVTVYTMFNNKTIMKETFNEYLRITNMGTIKGAISLIGPFVKGPLPNFINRIIKRIVGFGQVGTIINEVTDISLACTLIENEMKKRGEIKYE